MESTDQNELLWLELNKVRNEIPFSDINAITARQNKSDDELERVKGELNQIKAIHNKQVSLKTHLNEVINASYASMDINTFSPTLYGTIENNIQFSNYGYGYSILLLKNAKGSINVTKNIRDEKFVGVNVENFWYTLLPGYEGGMLHGNELLQKISDDEYPEYDVFNGMSWGHELSVSNVIEFEPNKLLIKSVETNQVQEIEFKDDNPRIISFHYINESKEMCADKYYKKKNVINILTIKIDGVDLDDENDVEVLLEEKTYELKVPIAIPNVFSHKMTFQGGEMFIAYGDTVVMAGDLNEITHVYKLGNNGMLTLLRYYATMYMELYDIYMGKEILNIMEEIGTETQLGLAINTSLALAANSERPFITKELDVDVSLENDIISGGKVDIKDVKIEVDDDGDDINTSYTGPKVGYILRGDHSQSSINTLEDGISLIAESEYVNTISDTNIRIKKWHTSGVYHQVSDYEGSSDIINEDPYFTIKITWQGYVGMVVEEVAPMTLYDVSMSYIGQPKAECYIDIKYDPISINIETGVVDIIARIYIREAGVDGYFGIKSISDESEFYGKDPEHVDEVYDDVGSWRWTVGKHTYDTVEMFDISDNIKSSRCSKSWVQYITGVRISCRVKARYKYTSSELSNYVVYYDPLDDKMMEAIGDLTARVDKIEYDLSKLEDRVLLIEKQLEVAKIAEIADMFVSIIGTVADMVGAKMIPQKLRTKSVDEGGKISSIYKEIGNSMNTRIVGGRKIGFEILTKEMDFIDNANKLMDYLSKLTKGVVGYANKILQNGITSIRRILYRGKYVVNSRPSDYELLHTPGIRRVETRLSAGIYNADWKDKPVMGKMYKELDKRGLNLSHSYMELTTVQNVGGGRIIRSKGKVGIAEGINSKTDQTNILAAKRNTGVGTLQYYYELIEKDGNLIEFPIYLPKNHKNYKDECLYFWKIVNGGNTSSVDSFHIWWAAGGQNVDKLRHECFLLQKRELAISKGQSRVTYSENATFSHLTMNDIEEVFGKGTKFDDNFVYHLTNNNCHKYILTVLGVLSQGKYRYDFNVVNKDVIEEFVNRFYKTHQIYDPFKEIPLDEYYDEIGSYYEHFKTARLLRKMHYLISRMEFYNQLRSLL